MFNKKQKKSRGLAPSGVRSTKSRGFTLIELLVVIAIIGLLAGIVLVSLGGARDSARDARIQGAMQQTRNLAELVYNYDNPPAYTDLCETTTNTLNDAHAEYGTQLADLDADILAQNSASAIRCNSISDEYCVSATLNNATVVCVDASGSTGSLVCGAATVCP